MNKTCISLLVCVCVALPMTTSSIFARAPATVNDPAQVWAMEIDAAQSQATKTDPAQSRATKTNGDGHGGLNIAGEFDRLTDLQIPYVESNIPVASTQNYGLTIKIPLDMRASDEMSKPFTVEKNPGSYRLQVTADTGFLLEDDCISKEIRGGHRLVFHYIPPAVDVIADTNELLDTITYSIYNELNSLEASDEIWVHYMEDHAYFSFTKGIRRT